jgi:hypothetical protein
LKLQFALEGFKSPVPAKAIVKAQVPLLLGRTVTRGPRESSSVYSETVQILGVEVVKVIPFTQEDMRPSVEETFASKNPPLIGIELGEMTLTRVD